MDEEIPQLHDQHQSSQQVNTKKQKTPLPWRQLSILLLLYLSEPLTSQIISPFLPQLIDDIGVTDGKDSRVDYFVGLAYSLFFLTEACTIFHWSRMSDRVGRKPILLTGLFGLSASMWCFGLSKTFWSVVLSRCLNGSLNGNIGVMKTMMIEITDSTNVAQAYNLLPIIWSFGSTVGPLIGGSLARPVERFPAVFGGSAFFKNYPYFLPCSVSASITALSWLTAFLFMKETLNAPMTLRQYIFGGVTIDGKRKLRQVHGDPHGNVEPEADDRQLPFRSLLVPPFFIGAGSYATVSFIDMTFRAISLVFYAAPIEMGGLNLDPPTIGKILAALGLSSGIIQYVLFSPIHDWLGSKTLYLVSVCLCFPMIALFPVINVVVRAHGLGYFVWSLVGLQLTLFIFACFAYAVTFMYVSAAAPNKASVGATNGLAQVTVSFMRGVGPIVATSTFSFSIGKHIPYGYPAYLLMAAMVGLALWVGYLLPRKPWN